MKTIAFTSPNAGYYAKKNCEMAAALIKGKTHVVRHTGERRKITEYFSRTMHSEEASQFELRNEDGVLAYFCNGQFWDVCTGTLVELV